MEGNINFLFDVDGTITPNRLKIDADFAQEFLDFCNTHKVFLVSGSDYKKLLEQLPEEILNSCQTVYSCSGNETYVQGKCLHKSIWQPPENLLHILEELIKTANTPIKTSNHIEIRNGMVNFSTIGRNCTIEQRNQYVRWETKSEERKNLIKNVLAPVFKELEFDMGGQISIDIYPKGTGKQQVLKHLTGPVMFFGDRVCEGGNDRTIATECLNIPNSSVFNIGSWQQTRSLLKMINSYI